MTKKNDSRQVVFKADTKLLADIETFRHVNRLQFRSTALQYMIEFALNHPAFKEFVKGKKEAAINDN